MNRIKLLLWTLATLLGASWIALWFAGGNRRRLATALWNASNRGLRRLYAAATVFVSIVLATVVAELILGGLGYNHVIPWVLLGTLVLVLVIGVAIVLWAPALSTLVGGVAIAQKSVGRGVLWGLGLHIAVGLLLWFTPTEDHWTLIVVILVSVAGTLFLTGTKGFLGAMGKVCMGALILVLTFLNTWERDWGAIQAPKSVRQIQENDLGIHQMTWVARPGTYTGVAGNTEKKILLEHAIWDGKKLTLISAEEDNYQSIFRGERKRDRIVGTWVTRGPRKSSGTFVLSAGTIDSGGGVVMDGQLLDTSGNIAASLQIRRL